jgi:hypothetical protein
MKKEYWIEHKQAWKSEKILRAFLFKKADRVRLTYTPWTEGFFKRIRHGSENDPKWIETKENLRPYFVRKVINNKRFNNLEQGKHTFTHYFFRLTETLKEMLTKETLIWLVNPPASKGPFYCFEDPTFYNGDKMIGGVITHEPYLFLYLTDAERKQLEKKGLSFNDK